MSDCDDRNMFFEFSKENIERESFRHAALQRGVFVRREAHGILPDRGEATFHFMSELIPNPTEHSS
jgi:hypothetical protein